jgi:Ala-tRNA(Pro) deacylase
MNGSAKLYNLLDQLGIAFDYHEHPEAPTIEEASKYWKDIPATHCKNLFFRNHKGNRHYLAILDCRRNLAIHDLEKLLRQGKLTFASSERLMKYLGLTPGSVSPFGLIHDHDRHVTVFLDESLKESEWISFHPCINTASLVISFTDFIRFLNFTGNDYFYMTLYNHPDV